MTLYLGSDPSGPLQVGTRPPVGDGLAVVIVDPGPAYGASPAPAATITAPTAPYAIVRPAPPAHLEP